jgi:NAD(P)-dependent dehydrogenase (short-subunit alcohol dehydrogenase family)
MGVLWFSHEADVPDMFGKFAIVTGGSSGIGFEVRGAAGRRGAARMQATPARRQRGLVAPGPLRRCARRCASASAPSTWP